MSPLYNGRSLSVTPTVSVASTPILNPFISNTVEKDTTDASTPGSWSNAVNTKMLSSRPLPPVPPRHAAKTNEPIRIPLHVVHSSKARNSENHDTSITSNGIQSKSVADKIKNGNTTNGHSDHNDIKLINHDLPCPCKSGAHPKYPKAPLQNGHYTPAPTLGKWNFMQHFATVIFYYFYTFAWLFNFAKRRTVANAIERWGSGCHTGNCSGFQPCLRSLQWLGKEVWRISVRNTPESATEPIELHSKWVKTPFGPLQNHHQYQNDQK